MMLITVEVSLLLVNNTKCSIEYWQLSYTLTPYEGEHLIIGNWQPQYYHSMCYMLQLRFQLSNGLGHAPLYSHTITMGGHSNLLK